MVRKTRDRHHGSSSVAAMVSGPSLWPNLSVNSATTFNLISKGVGHQTHNRLQCHTHACFRSAAHTNPQAHTLLTRSPEFRNRKDRIAARA